MIIGFSIKMLCILVLCPILLAAVQTLTIDSQLGTSIEDCFERISIGEQLPFDSIYRNVSELTTRECEQICKQDKQCQTYDYGVGAKGNATCNLSNLGEKEIKEKGLLNRHPDYDVYVRRLQCEQSPPTPIQAQFDDPEAGPQHRPVFRPNDDDPTRPLADEYPIRPVRPNRPNQNYIDHDRPDDYINSKPDFDRPPSYGAHSPPDIPFPDNQYQKPVKRPGYDVLQFQDPYRPNKPHDTGYYRPDPHYPPHPNDDIPDLYGQRPSSLNRPFHTPYQPEKPEYHYIIRPNRKPRPQEDTGYGIKPLKPQDYPTRPDPYGQNDIGHPSGPIGPPDRPYKPNRPYDYPFRPYDRPNYSYNSQYASNYGQTSSYNDNSIYLEIYDPPRPYKPYRPTRPEHDQGLGGYGQNFGYGQSSYGSSHTHAHNSQSNYYGTITEIDNFNQNRPSHDSGYGPSKPSNRPVQDTGYGGQKPIYDSQKPSYDSQSGYGNKPNYDTQKPSYNTQKPSYDSQPGYGNKPNYDTQKPSYDTQKPGYDQKPDYDRPSFDTQPGYNKPNYDTQKPVYDTHKPAYDKPGYNDKPSYDSQRPSYSKPEYDTQKPGYGSYDQDSQGYGISKPNDKPSYGNQGSYESSDSSNRPSYGTTNDFDNSNYGFQTTKKPEYQKPDRPSYGVSNDYNNQASYGSSSSSYGSSSSNFDSSYNNKLTYSDSKPSYGQSSQSYGSSGQSYGSSSQSYDTSSQSYGSSNKPYSDDKPYRPTYNDRPNRPDERPSYGNKPHDNRPSYTDDNRPNDSNRPSYTNDNRPNDSNRPSYTNGNRPNDNRPSYTDSRPDPPYDPGQHDLNEGYSKPKPSNSYQDKPDVKPVYEYEMDKPSNVPSYIVRPSGDVVTSRPVTIGDYGDRGWEGRRPVSYKEIIPASLYLCRGFGTSQPHIRTDVSPV